MNVLSLTDAEAALLAIIVSKPEVLDCADADRVDGVDCDKVHLIFTDESVDLEPGDVEALDSLQQKVLALASTTSALPSRGIYEALAPRCQHSDGCAIFADGHRKWPFWLGADADKQCNCGLLTALSALAAGAP